MACAACANQPQPASVHQAAAATSTTTWIPTSGEIAATIAYAHLEADGTTPSLPGLVPSNIPGAPAWPPNVTSVSYVATTQQVAIVWMQDGSATAPGLPVMVVRMEGQFSVLTSAPYGAPPYETGNEVTFMLDPVTGALLGFGLVQTANPQALPDGTVYFTR